MAQRLLQDLHQTDFVTENNRLHGSASIGIVTCPDHGQNRQTPADPRRHLPVPRQADQAQPFHVFSDEDLSPRQQDARHDLLGGRRIKQALQEDQISRCSYQPIQPPLVGEKREANEALLRISDDNGDLIARPGSSARPPNARG